MCDIDPATGLVCFEEEDFSLNGDNPLFFTRRYNNHSHYEGSFGLGWLHPYDVHLSFSHGELAFTDSEARTIPMPGLVRGARVELPAEDLIGESGPAGYLLHQVEGRMLTFAKTPLGDGRLPLIRLDQTDENSLFLSYKNDRLEEVRSTSYHQIQFVYTNSRISHIVLRDRAGRDISLVSYSYHGNGQLAAVYDAERRPVLYEYSGGLLTRATNRMGGSFYLKYDTHRRATGVWQDGASRLRKVLYDDKNRTRLVTNSLGYSTLLRYNENGLLIETNRFDGSRIERAYANGNEPIGVTGLGPQPVSHYDPESNIIEEIDPDGRVAKLRYDERNRIVEEIDSDGGVTRYDYDEHNRITRQVDPLGGVNVLEFNENGNLLRHSQPLGNDVRAVRSDTHRLDLEDSLGPLDAAESDSFGNITRITAASGRTTDFEYDLFGRFTLVKTNGHTASNWYDANGYLIAETDLAGNRTEYERDPFGLLQSWTNPLGRRIDYSYDSERRLISGRSSDGIECRYSYDSRGRLVHMKLRDGREETISYDENGRRSAFSDLGGQITKYSYTPAGLLSEIESPTGSATYKFDAAGNCIFAECDHHSVVRKWAPGERLLTERQDDFQIDYEHNAAGLVTLRRDSSGRVTRYTYNVRGQLTEIVDSLFGAHEIRRDRIGSETEHRLANGLVRQFEYGADDEISIVVTRRSAGEKLCERTYRYAPNGELIEAQTTSGEWLRFQYDPEYQLTAVSGAEQDSEAFTYDLDHSVTHISRLGQCLYENNRLVSAGNLGYQYDSSGRISTKQTGERATRFSYGLGGLVREASTPDGSQYMYEYDGMGRRVRKIGPGISIRYYWDQDVLLCEERETPLGKSTTSYLFLPDTFVPLAHAVDGTCFYYELDQRSLIREVYDAQGDVVAHFAYHAFGERRTLQLSVPDADPPFRLLGQTWDQETGLHYNRFRYYDADTGRFLSPDLSTHQVEHNPYSYSPNPINWADPNGLMARFSQAKALAYVEEEGAKTGMFECSGCGFRNKNRVFARTAETGRPVGDGAFHAGHKNAHANNGSGNVKRNAKVEGGTCNCSKGKRKKSGMT